MKLPAFAGAFFGISGAARTESDGASKVATQGAQ